MSEGKHHPAEFPPGTCTNTAPPTTTTPLPFSGSSRTPHPHGGKPKDGKPAPGAVTGRDPPQTEPCGGPRTAPAFCLPGCPHLPAGPPRECLQQKEPQTRAVPRAPLPFRAAPSPLRQNILRAAARRGPASLPPSLPPPAGPARPAGKGGRRSAGTDGEGQAGSPVSTWHCPPGSSRHPAVSPGKEVSTIHRLLLTNY